MPAPTHVILENLSAGGHLVTPDSSLPLVAAAVRVEARGGMAHVTCEQRFKNHGREPLSVTYSLPLPADAAVSGFSFLMGDRRIAGEIERTEAARERFEEALALGRTAALLEQDRSSLFTQELGNIPPGVEVTAQVTIDQRLVWLDEGSWEWRFPTTVMPRYLGEPARVPDASRITQAIADAPLAPRLRLAMTIGDRMAEGGAPSSPAHPLRSAPGREVAAGWTVELATDEGIALDRDVVVRWPVAGAAVGLSLETARRAPGAPSGDSAAHGLLTIVPPQRDQQSAPIPRDLIVLLDTSGSMAGRPLEQAQKVIAAIIGSLADEDTLELIEFAQAARRWKEQPVRASESARRDALAWLKGRKASGATEMRSGILEALRPIRANSQRQVILVTDGAIGFESEVVAAIREMLSPSCRLHTVGIGSAVNRSLTAPAARAGRGIEIVLGLDEDPERAGRRLLRRTVAPLVVGLELRGSALLAHAPRRLPDLFAGSPVLVGLELRTEGGELSVRGSKADGSNWEQTLRVHPIAPSTGQAAASLFARELVEDLELELAAGGGKIELRSQIESAGLRFAIATRFTSWVAISEEPSVDPTKPSRRVRMPHELPHGTSVQGIGLRAMPAPGSFGAMVVGRAVMSVDLGAPRMRAAAPAPGSSAPGRAERGPIAGAVRKVRGWFDPRALRGRVLVRKPRELAISIAVESDFDWAAGPSVLVEWADGTRVAATVDTSRSTAAGKVTGGQSVRVWLQFSVDVPADMPILLRLSDRIGDRVVMLGTEGG